MQAILEPIGHIETPYGSRAECPRNIDPTGPLCTLVIRPELEGGLLGLQAGQEILLLYWFQDVDRNRLQDNRRGTDELRGVFALRTPHRPNPIAAAVVRVEGIRSNRIFVRGMDCLNGTPLLDIKPAIMSEKKEETP